MADDVNKSLDELLKKAQELKAKAEEQRKESERLWQEHELRMARFYRDSPSMDQEPGHPQEPNVGAPSIVVESSQGTEHDDGAQSNLEYDGSTPNALNAVALRREEVYLENQQQNLALRKSIAEIAVWAVGIQMFLTNVTFVGYMNAVDYQPEPVVMISWMTSTVVQIVGIAMVVTRNLFPRRNGNSKKDEERDL